MSIESNVEMMRTFLIRVCGLAFLALLMSVAPAKAQNTGNVKVHVSPKQAYVFVDGKAIRDGSQTLDLSAGSHTIGVDNYGYMPAERTVDVVAGQTMALDVSLQKSGGKVDGPFGDIELKGHPRAAVLLNGNTPAYFVGHVDEFDNNWIWHQWLLVKPGVYQVTATQKGQTIWSGPVTVKAGERVIVDLNHDGRMRTRDFKKGLALGPQPRFDTGVASAMIPIAPVTAQLSAQSNQVTCGQPTDLDWKSANAVDSSITNIGNVPASGERSVDPKQPTTYQLVAKGPGGEVREAVTVNVNNAQPTATIALSQLEVTYRKIGDKVVEQGSATLNWSVSNAKSVTIEPRAFGQLGSVANSGSQNIEVTPNQTSTGPIDQDVTYTLTAANACGGRTTRTATLHVAGSIEPAPPVTLASVFYPTAYPERRHPQAGLVSADEKTLAKAADTFKEHKQYDNQPNKLMVVGHADVRGPEQYNQLLSERRVELVKNYLVSQGIAADLIETQADGKDKELTQQQVENLQSQDKQPPQKWMTEHQKTTWLAYNRRVDIILEPQGQQSAEVYPNDTPDTRVLWERPVPNLKTVESLSQAAQNQVTNNTEQARSSQ